MTAADKAWELRAKLFALVNEFKDFHLAVSSARAGGADAREGAATQADAVACKLAGLHAAISGPSPDYDLFTDAASDAKDRRFDFRLRDGVAEEFAATLTRLRDAAGLNQNQLAEKSGLSREAIRRYEAGDRRPTWDAVQQLAAALGVATDVFRDQG